MPLIERYYLLFFNIYKYAKDVIEFFDNVQKGIVFIHHTLEKILSSRDGAQLLSESIYLYGVMLILLDSYIPGNIRERILVSYRRYKKDDDLEENEFNEICKLMQSTGLNEEDYRSSKKKNKKKKGGPPKDYPIKFFSRIQFPEEVINIILGKLKTEDIYKQSQYYPHPSHRSVAYATQAAMLYVMLYFQPNTLLNEKSTMREIVDKHFPDNWIISFYMGFKADLVLKWNNFPAAKAAIGNTIELENVKKQASVHLRHLEESIKEVKGFLREGVLVEDYILDHLQLIFDALRRANVTLRWCILHRRQAHKKLAEIIKISSKRILLLLLETAQMEYVLEREFNELLQNKEAKWTTAKTEAKECMKNLERYFSGEGALNEKEKDEQLQQWFGSMEARIEKIDFSDETTAGRKIQNIIQALHNVEEMPQIDTQPNVKHYLNKTRDLLKKMIRYVNIRDSVVVILNTVSDISYAWELIQEYVGEMQENIKEDPGVIVKMRSIFIKLSSMLYNPLIRIRQAETKDDVSVSLYYSSELVLFVRRTMDIIPQEMFNVLNKIIRLQTDQLRHLPVKIPEDKINEFAQLDVRRDLSHFTHEISKFTEGILAMKKTAIGAQEIDSKTILETGVRKELVRQISKRLNDYCIFPAGTKLNEFEDKLSKLATSLDGINRSFEYIQDYVGIYGLRIWHEEFQRIINYYTEQESNRYLKRKFHAHQSLFQKKIIPIPNYKSPQPSATTFIGRIIHELLIHTDPRKTIYIDQLSGWYDEKGKETIGLQTFVLLKKAIDVFGLIGVDTILSFIILKQLQGTVHVYERVLLEDKQIHKDMVTLENELTPTSTLPKLNVRVYDIVLRHKKVVRMFPEILANVIRIGRAQLLRRHITNQLEFSSKLDAHALSLSLQVMNDAVLSEIRENERDPEKHPYPINMIETEDGPEEVSLLSEMDQYLETSGMADPLEKIYITNRPLPQLGLFFFLFVIHHANRFKYDQNIDSLIRAQKNDQIDGIPFVVGIITVLKQFNIHQRRMFLRYMGQYVKMIIVTLQLNSKALRKAPSFPASVKFILRFLQYYTKYSSLARKEIETYIPSYIYSDISV